MEEKRNRKTYNVLSTISQGGEGKELTEEEIKEAINMQWPEEEKKPDDKKENEKENSKIEIEELIYEEKRNKSDILYLMESMHQMEIKMEDLQKEIKNLKEKIKKNSNSPKIDPHPIEERKGEKIIHKKNFLFETDEIENYEEFIKKMRVRKTEGEIIITKEEKEEIYYIIVKLNNPLKLKSSETRGLKYIGVEYKKYEEYEKKNLLTEFHQEKKKKKNKTLKN